MKNGICFLLLFLSFAGHSQVVPIAPLNTPTNSRFYFSLLNSGVNPLSFNAGLMPQNTRRDQNMLMIYNPSMQLNDVYYQNGLSQQKEFSFYSYEGIRMDSLNPYGSANIKDAILNGVFGSLGLDFLTSPLDCNCLKK